LQALPCRSHGSSASIPQVPIISLGSTEMLQVSSESAFTTFPIEFHAASFNASKHAFTSKNALMHLAARERMQKKFFACRVLSVTLQAATEHHHANQIQSRNV
jgi:hypothetical protein